MNRLFMLSFLFDVTLMVTPFIGGWNLLWFYLGMLGIFADVYRLVTILQYRRFCMELADQYEGTL